MRRERKNHSGKTTRRNGAATAGIVALGLSVLASTREAHASNMTGGVVIVLIGEFIAAGAVIGGGIGLIVCLAASNKSGARAWMRWPYFPLFGVGGGILLVIAMGLFSGERPIASVGHYRRFGRSITIAKVPETFKEPELKRYHALINNGKNPVLSGHTYAVALVHRKENCNYVYLTSEPELPLGDGEVWQELCAKMKALLAELGAGAG